MTRRAPSMPTRGTTPQRLLERSLRALGLETEWEDSPSDFLSVKPDLLFRHQRVAVFVDGCQWHKCPIHFRPHRNPAHGLSEEGAALQAHSDKVHREALAKKGYRVLAFWEHDIRRDAAHCARQVMAAVSEPWRR